MPSRKNLAKRRRGLRIAREQESRRKFNELMRTMRRMAASLDAEDLFLAHIAPHKNEVFGSRVGRLRIDAEPHCGIDSALVTSIRGDLTEYLDTFTVPMAKGHFTLSEIFSAGMTLALEILLLKQRDEAAGSLFEEVAAPLFEAFEGGSAASDELDLCLLAFASECSRIDRANFWFTYQSLKNNASRGAVHFRIHRKEAEIRRVIIDGKRRPVYRVSAPMHGSMWAASIKREALEGFADFEIPEVPLYVQGHALVRMYERCEPISKSLSGNLLVWAALDPHIVRAKDGSLLLRLTLRDQTLGYLVLLPLPDMLVGRTFLFVTQNGTPEGDRLTELVRLHPREKKYLQLDKLSTFLTTDIAHDEKLMAIFKECGLEHIKEIQERLSLGVEEKCAAEVRKYLQLDTIQLGGEEE